jgi:hypothetical protein
MHSKPWTLSAVYRTAWLQAWPERQLSNLSSVEVHHEDVLVHTPFGTTTDEVDVLPIL